MKKIRALACLLTALLFSYAFVSCSDTTEEVVQTKSISIMLNSESFSVSDVYRTILPESWTYGINPKSASLKYVITAFSIANPNVDDGVIGTDAYSITVDYAGLTSSQGVNFSLRPGSWRIILSAYKEDAVLSSTAASSELDDGSFEYYARGATDCIFTDSQTITLDSETNMESLVFNLISVTNDNAAKGTLSLNFTMYPPDTCSTVAWYLSKYGDTFTPISGTSRTYEFGTASFSEQFASRSSTVKGCSAYYYTKSAITQNVVPGKYWFVLTFTDKNNMRMLTYPILVVIDGDNTSYGDMILRNALFNSAPLSCSDLRLEYVAYGGYSVGSDDTHAKAEGSYVALAPGIAWNTRYANGLYEEFDSVPTASYVFHFGLLHTWTDNADNEKEYHYVLENNGSTVADSSIAAGRTSLSSLIDAPYSTSGTLIDYDFSIRAENDYSSKAGTYIDTTGFNEWQQITGKKVFMLLYQLSDGIRVAYASGDSFSGAGAAYFGVPYVTGTGETIELLRGEGGSYPCVTNLPAGKTLLGWQVGGQGTTLTTLEEASGVNEILTPVFSE